MLYPCCVRVADLGQTDSLEPCFVQMSCLPQVPFPLDSVARYSHAPNSYRSIFRRNAQCIINLVSRRCNMHYHRQKNIHRQFEALQEIAPDNTDYETQTDSCMLEYSLSTPGSISEACPRIRTPDAPISQKIVEMGDDNQRRGIPITKSPVYRCFCVTVCSPNCVASGAVNGGELNVWIKTTQHQQHTKTINGGETQHEESQGY